MDRVAFEAELRREGFTEVLDRRMEAGKINDEHAHAFDARLLILDGEMAITRDGAEHTYRAGDSFTMAAGRRHGERSGPAGVRYLAGHRYPPQPAG